MLSKFRRFAPPLTFRSEKRIKPGLLTVKLAVFSVVEVMLMVLPTFE